MKRKEIWTYILDVEGKIERIVEGGIDGSDVVLLGAVIPKTDQNLHRLTSRHSLWCGGKEGTSARSHWARNHQKIERMEDNHFSRGYRGTRKR